MLLTKRSQIRNRRKNRTRSKLFGTASRPRMSIMRSNKYTYVQFIDDEAGKTLVSASTKEIDQKGSKTDHAKVLAEKLVKKLKDQKIEQAIVDRGAYKYHGRIKALAEAFKEQGIKI